MVVRLISQLANLANPNIARVVVTHNRPDPEMPKPLNARFDFVQVHNPRPLGFAVNHNNAFGYCDTPWFAVLNPDVELTLGDPFPALIETGEAHPDLGVLGPTLVDPATMRQEKPRGRVTPYEIIRRRLPGWQPPDSPAWIVGAFLMIRSSAFRQIGGFDERYRLYCEDVDLSVRMQLAGWTVECMKDVLVLHHKQHGSHRSMQYAFWHLSSLYRLWTSSLRRRFSSS